MRNRRLVPARTVIRTVHARAAALVAAWAVAFAAAGDFTAGVTAQSLLATPALAAGAALLATIQSNRRPPD